MSSEKPWAKLIDHIGRPLDRMPDAVSPGANAVLVVDGQILLHKRADNGHWALPGGRMEIGESAGECAVRETEEETGVKVRVKRLIGVYSDPRNYSILVYPGGEIIQHVIMLFEVERTGGAIAVSHESTEVRFWPVDALPEPMLPSARIRIEDALSGAQAPFSR
jgi:ADP-ribose pyrophosphatase YjhB (NUDIX family)